MNKIEFEQYQENINDFVLYGILPKNTTIDDLKQKIAQLSSNQIRVFSSTLKAIGNEIFHPAPMSSPYIPLLMYAPDAFRRAFIMGCIAGTSSFLYDGSASSALMRGMGAGLTLFMGSICYDTSKVNIPMQLKRLQLLADSPCGEKLSYSI